MDVYITKLNGLDQWNSLQYRQQMNAEIAHQLGYREMGIYSYDRKSESTESLNGRLDGIIAGIRWGEDVVVCQFPTENGFEFEWELVNRLRFYRSRIVIFIHDSGALVCESDQTVLTNMIRLYNQAEVLIVPSLLMYHFLLDNGIKNGMKFVVQEMWDYIFDARDLNSSRFCKEIHFIGSDGVDEINNWNYTVPLKVYTNLNVQGKNVYHTVGVSQGEIISTLSKGGFGLIWYQNENSQKRMEYDISFDLIKYLAAGIPVIVPSGISNQTLIEKNHLGVIVNSLNEAIDIVDNIKEPEYWEYFRCVDRFAMALRNGFYTKKSLITAIQTVYRNDAAWIPMSAKLYNSKDNVFTITVLKKSYGENLALSWSYCGDADGFLVYDISGKLIYETRNVYQHYLLIRGYGKESGFTVKAYIDTLKGKLIVAESVLSCLHKTQYVKPEVSLIIPVYNAEDYIVRSIDTALAQSFSDLEIIIVDDGSTDHTSDIINWYAERYLNLKVIHQENRGPAVARNTGIKYASGEYIEFLDSDDMIRPDMVAGMHRSVKENDCDIAVTSAYMIKDNHYDIWIQYPNGDTVLTIEEFFEMYFKRGWKPSAVVWNKLYRSSLVKKHLFPEIISEDEAWTPYILSYVDKICCYGNGYYEYDRVIRKSTLVNQVMGRSKEEIFIIIKNAICFYLKNGNQDKMEVLVEYSRIVLQIMKKSYAYEKFETLWHQIEESFRAIK